MNFKTAVILFVIISAAALVSVLSVKSFAQTLGEHRNQEIAAIQS